MTNNLVSRFRVKKLSPKQRLPVYKASQLPDLLDDAIKLNRSVPIIETGVEKEEEEEHDLQAAINAAHAAVTTGAKMNSYIPTPDASHTIDMAEYNRIYTKPFDPPQSLIRFNMTDSDLFKSHYVLDEYDMTFLAQLNQQSPVPEDELESVMDQIEHLVNIQMPHLDLDPLQIPSYPELIKMLPESLSTDHPALESIILHWRQRRIQRSGKPIIPQLHYEESARKGDSDPYVCFRRRDTRSTRKTRRTDQQASERLRKLRREMEKARNLCGMVLRREKLRKEGFSQEHAVFVKRCELRGYQAALGIKEEDIFTPAYKKKRHKRGSHTSGSTTIKIPLSRLRDDDPSHGKSLLQLAIEKDLARKREEDIGFEDITACPYQPFPLDLPCHFFNSFSPKNDHAPQFRKRIGRGGRIFIDRTRFKAPVSSIDDRYRFDPDIDPTKEDVVEEYEEEDCLEYLWNTWQQPNKKSKQHQEDKKQEQKIPPLRIRLTSPQTTTASSSSSHKGAPHHTNNRIVP
ncbi:enhancer of polycomb-like protein 1 [Lichtheimia corymbifera JMRC:FSU:9682]|uniref:Enhancer of polycomb-like protein n=1 Tax=Lichtheimia corymbifera JMRC:FSU:9682 TaxID=1263082 RepID=A0A068S1T7_9FUNG|nr:enhancer of polycomb-like protein 1 [Lichtheimia corymbifera JMRC:FSU:9682]